VRVIRMCGNEGAAGAASTGARQHEYLVLCRGRPWRDGWAHQTRVDALARIARASLAAGRTVHLLFEDCTLLRLSAELLGENGLWDLTGPVASEEQFRRVLEAVFTQVGVPGAVLSPHYKRRACVEAVLRGDRAAAPRFDLVLALREDGIPLRLGLRGDNDAESCGPAGRSPAAEFSALRVLFVLGGVRDAFDSEEDAIGGVCVKMSVPCRAISLGGGPELTSKCIKTLEVAGSTGLLAKAIGSTYLSGDRLRHLSEQTAQAVGQLPPPSVESERPALHVVAVVPDAELSFLLTCPRVATLLVDVFRGSHCNHKRAVLTLLAKGGFGVTIRPGLPKILKEVNALSFLKDQLMFARHTTLSKALWGEHRRLRAASGGAQDLLVLHADRSAPPLRELSAADVNIESGTEEAVAVVFAPPELAEDVRSASRGAGVHARADIGDIFTGPAFAGILHHQGVLVAAVRASSECPAAARVAPTPATSKPVPAEREAAEADAAVGPTVEVSSELPTGSTCAWPVLAPTRLPPLDQRPPLLELPRAERKSWADVVQLRAGGSATSPATWLEAAQLENTLDSSQEAPSQDTPCMIHGDKEVEEAVLGAPAAALEQGEEEEAAEGSAAAAPEQGEEEEAAEGAAAAALEKGEEAEAAAAEEEGQEEATPTMDDLRPSGPDENWWDYGEGGDGVNTPELGTVQVWIACLGGGAELAWVPEEIAHDLAVPGPPARAPAAPPAAPAAAPAAAAGGGGQALRPPCGAEAVHRGGETIIFPEPGLPSMEPEVDTSWSGMACDMDEVVHSMRPETQGGPMDPDIITPSKLSTHMYDANFLVNADKGEAESSATQCASTQSPPSAAGTWSVEVFDSTWPDDVDHATFMESGLQCASPNTCASGPNVWQAQEYSPSWLVDSVGSTAMLSVAQDAPEGPSIATSSGLLPLPNDSSIWMAQADDFGRLDNIDSSREIQSASPYALVQPCGMVVNETSGPRGNKFWSASELAAQDYLSPAAWLDQGDDSVGRGRAGEARSATEGSPTTRPSAGSPAAPLARVSGSDQPGQGAPTQLLISTSKDWPALGAGIPSKPRGVWSGKCHTAGSRVNVAASTAMTSADQGACMGPSIIPCNGCCSNICATECAESSCSNDTDEAETTRVAAEVTIENKPDDDVTEDVLTQWETQYATVPRCLSTPEVQSAQAADATLVDDGDDGKLDCLAAHSAPTRLPVSGVRLGTPSPAAGDAPGCEAVAAGTAAGAGASRGTSQAGSRLSWADIVRMGPPKYAPPPPPPSALAQPPSAACSVTSRQPPDSPAT